MKMSGNIVAIELDIICDPLDLIADAWSYHVTFLPVREENGNAVIWIVGEHDAVKAFCESLGYEDEFDAFIEEYRPC